MNGVEAKQPGMPDMLPAALVKIDKDVEELLPIRPGCERGEPSRGPTENSVCQPAATDCDAAWIAPSRIRPKLVAVASARCSLGRKWTMFLVARTRTSALTASSAPSTPMKSSRSQRSLVSPESELQFPSHLADCFSDRIFGVVAAKHTQVIAANFAVAQKANDLPLRVRSRYHGATPIKVPRHPRR